MDKRLKAAVLLLSMNLSLNGPVAQVALAEGASVSLTLPAEIAAGKQEQLHANFVGDGITASAVTFSVQLKQTGEVPGDLWEMVGTDTVPTDGFAIAWPHVKPGQYWVRAVAVGENGVELAQDVKSTAVLGYHISGRVSLSGMPNAQIRIQVEGPNLAAPLTAILGQGEGQNQWGRYAVVRTDENGEPMAGEVRYYFDLPAGQYKITAYAEDYPETRMESASVFTDAVVSQDFGYGTYFAQTAPALAPGQGPMIAWKPVQPTPVAGVESTIAFTPTAGPDRTITEARLFVQPRLNENAGPAPDGWMELPLTPQLDGNHAAKFVPPNAGAYWLRAEVADNQGVRYWSISQSFYAMVPMPTSYPLRGGIWLGEGIERHRVTLEVTSTSLPQPIKLTDGQWLNGHFLGGDPNNPNRLQYEVSLPAVDTYTVRALYDGQAVSAQVALTATGGQLGDLILALPTAEVFQPNPSHPVTGSTVKLSGLAWAPEGRQIVNPVRFGYQVAKPEHGPLETEWHWLTAMNDGNGAWHADWMNVQPGEYWIGMQVQDSEGARVVQVLHNPIRVMNPRLHGWIQAGPGVNRETVTLTITSDNLAAPRVLTYVPQRPTDGSDNLSADFHPDSLHYEVTLPPGTYTVKAEGGGFTAQKTVTLGGESGQVPGMHLPPMLVHPTVTYADQDADRVYMDGQTITLELSGLGEIEDGTVVKPIFQVPVFNGNKAALGFEIFEMTGSPTVTGGKVRLTGKLLRPTEPVEIYGPMEVELWSADGAKALTQNALVEAEGQRTAMFAAFGQQPDVTITPALSSFNNLGKTDQPLTVTRSFTMDNISRKVGSVTFGSGLNLLPEHGWPGDIGWAVHMYGSPGGFMARIGTGGDLAMSLPGLPVKLEIFEFSKQMDLEGLTPENLLEQVMLTAEDANGQVLTGPAAGQLIDLPSVAYDATTDTLTMQVKEFRGVHIRRMPALQLDMHRLDLNRQEPQRMVAWLPVPGPLTVAPVVQIRDAAGNDLPDAIVPGSVKLLPGSNGVEFMVNPIAVPGEYKVVTLATEGMFSGFFEVREAGLQLSIGGHVKGGFTEPIPVQVSNFGFELHAGDTLTATLLTHDGQELPGALMSSTATVQADGDYLFAAVDLMPGLPHGFYRLRFALGNGWEEAGFAVTEPYNVMLELRDPAGSPMANMDVVLREVTGNPADPGAEFHLHVDDFGRGAALLKPGATYRPVVIHRFDGPIHLMQPDFTVPVDGEMHLTLAPRIVKLHVRDEKGLAMPGARVTLAPAANPSQMITVHTSGASVVPVELPPGDYLALEVGPHKTRLAFTVTDTQLSYDLQVEANVLLRLYDQNDQPARNASIFLREAGANTGPRFELRTNDQGEAQAVLPPGAEFIIDEIFLPNGVVRPDLRLVIPSDGSLVTRVIQNNVHLTVKNEHGIPMANTRVGIKSDDGTTFVADTDANGVVGRLLKPGAYRILEVSNDMRRVAVDIPFYVSATQVHLDVALPMKSVEVTVRGENGSLVAHANLQIRSANQTNVFNVQTDRDGVARFDLPRGASYVLVDVGSPAGVVPVWRGFDVPTEGQAALEISIAANVDTVLQDEKGAPMPYAGLTIVGAEGFSRLIQTDAGGRFRTRLELGTYRIMEVRSGNRTIRPQQAFTVGANLFTAPLQIAAPNVLVAVTGDGGLPMIRAMVEIRPAEAGPTQADKSIWAETDSEGKAGFYLTAGVRYRIVQVGIRPVGREFTAPDKAGAEPIRVDLAANVVATVHDEESRPMPYALVALLPDDGNGQPVTLPEQMIFATANVQGVFSINLKPGRYHVVEISNGHRHIRTGIELNVDSANGYRGNVNVPVPNVKLQVTKSGVPVPRAWVQIRPAGMLAVERSTFVETDAMGVARALLTPGIRYVVVDVGGTRVGKEFTAPVADLQISLDTNVSASLVDDGEMPFTTAWVTIRPDDGTGRPALAYDKAIFAGTNDAGLLNLNLEPGQYHVVEIGAKDRFLRTDIPFTVTANGFSGKLQMPKPNTVVTVTGDGGPVAKAWVQIRLAGARPDEYEKSLWAETDENGVLRLRLAAGTAYTVVDVGTPQGITMAGKEFVTPASGSTSPVQVNISLASNVDLTLGDEEGQPMPEARITIRPVGGNTTAAGAFERTAFAMTDHSGRFRINLEPGEYRIVEVAAQERYVKTDVPLSVPQGGISGDMVRLPAANVAITVTRGLEKVDRAWIQVRPADARPDEYQRAVWTQTNRDGVAKLKLNPGSDYVVVDVGMPQGVTLVNQPFSVPQNGAANVTVSVTPNVAVTLREGNSLLGDAWVTIRSTAAAGRVFWAHTDEAGRLRINLPTGQYEITEIGSAARFIRTKLALDVSGGSFDGELTVQSANVRVAVVSGGAPVARAMVQFVRENVAGGPAVWAETDELGFAEAYLEPGNYVLADVGTPNGVTQVQLPVAVPDSGMAETLTVSLSARVTGRLLDENGDPMDQAWLALKPDLNGKPLAGSARTVHAKTAADGTFQVSLQPGLYHVVELGNSTRYIRTDLLMTVDANGLATTVQLAPASVRATVRLGEQVVPFAKVAVSLAAADPAAPEFWDSVLWFQADANGNVAMDLAAGEYVIRDVDTPTQRFSLGEAPVQFTVSGAGNDAQVQIALPAGE